VQALEPTIRSDTERNLIALNILIAVRSLILTEGLSELLRSRHHFHLMASPASKGPSDDAGDETAPDVILLNFDDPDCLSSARHFNRRFPGVRLLALGVEDVDEQLDGCAGVGICGYTSPLASGNELIAIIETIGRGVAPCSPGIAAALLRRAANVAANYPLTPIGLTHREVQVVRCLQEGLANKAIARRLGIRVPTVKNHVHNVLVKLGARRRRDRAVLDLGRI